MQSRNLAHGSKYFASTPTLTLGVKIHVAYQIKGNQECRNMVANIFLADRPHPLTRGLGSKGQISTFSEHGHVANQIKWNHEMQQHGSKYFARRSQEP